MGIAGFATGVEESAPSEIGADLAEPAPTSSVDFGGFNEIALGLVIAADHGGEPPERICNDLTRDDAVESDLVVIWGEEVEKLTCGSLGSEFRGDFCVADDPVEPRDIHRQGREPVSRGSLEELQRFLLFAAFEVDERECSKI